MPFTPREGDYNEVEALTGFDGVDINGFLLNEIAEGHIQGMPKGAAKKLYLQLDQILLQEDAEEILREKTKALSHEQKALYAKFLIIRNSCRAASEIIAIGNAVAEDDTYDIDRMIGETKDKGVSSEQLGEILGTITQWKTGTSHPTQHLSEEGKQLFRALLKVNSLPAKDRAEHLQKTIGTMFETDLTRKNKMDVREETKSDREQAKLQRQAQRQTFRELSKALRKHYPDNAPDLLEGYIRMNLPYHTWNGAGDADGKPNADKRALLEGMTVYTLDAIQEHLDDVNKAIELDPSLAETLGNAQKSLETVRDRLSALEAKMYADEDMELDFDDLKAEFADVYKGLNLGFSKDSDVAVNSEKDMYEKLTVGLHQTIKNGAGEDAKEVLSESLFVMRQYKNTFTTARIEVRAPGPVDVDIMNKLFNDKEFQIDFLDSSMRRALANRSFTTLSDDEQREMMQYAGKVAQEKPREAKKHYYRIFPEGEDDKGFPNQLRERGERLELQGLVPDKFGMSIVAEASKMSPEYQLFLGENFFGVGRMMHTMLNEDMDTLDHAADFAIDFTKHGGLTSVMNAVAHDPRLANYFEKHGVMLPCSDSVKQLGPGAPFIQAQAINLLMRYAVENKKTIYIKWGNGQDINRGGGNANIPGRLKAQALQEHLQGRVLDPCNEDDLRLIANITYASNTEQGKASDFVSHNADSISGNHLKMISEMLGRTLELMGKVSRGTYITQAAKFSKNSRSVLADIAKNTLMRGYENFRDAVDAKGNRLSDGVASTVSNMTIAGDANQAARPDSKAVEVTGVTSEEALAVKKEGKPLYNLRAIGTTIAVDHMRTHHDGWFSLGAGLKAVHEAHISGELSKGDLKVFLKDPLWAGIVKNGLRNVSMSDLTYGFEKLDAGDWSHEKAMRIGKSVEVIPAHSDADTPLFTFDGADEGITPQQAYMAKLYYDQALFITYAEKMAQMTLEGTPLPNRGNSKNKADKAFKKIEQATVLHLDHEGEGIGRFEIGAYTKALFPFVDQDRNRNRIEALPAQILCDVCEDYRNLPENDSEYLSTEIAFAVTASHRATQTWANADSYKDQDAYGSKMDPKIHDARMEHIRAWETQYDVAVRVDGPGYEVH